jgi:hypothetical protein
MKTINHIILALIYFSVLNYTGTVFAMPAKPPIVTLSALPATVTSGAATTIKWSATNAVSCTGTGGTFAGTHPISGTFTSTALQSTTTFSISCTNGFQASAPVQTTVLVSASASTKLGINLGWVNDWGDRSLTFVDIMKQARGFAALSNWWDPGNHPAPTDANGWPTTDFGIVFTSTTSDPLNRPYTSTYPSLFGTYTLSFTGQATITGYGSGLTISKQVYNQATNTTTANVVVGATATGISLGFTNTVNGLGHGVQNLKLLRPGYALGTTQVFTTQFLNALTPFSTLRFMDFLSTNANPVTSWAGRKQASDPTQNDTRGVAWEYVIALANATNKDIWINIPEGVNLNDTSSNNYITQLAKLLKTNLNPNIHVYVEYSNELWNYAFSQATSNLNAAISDIQTGIDHTLIYDNSTNQWDWAARRVAHQSVKISELFSNVYGAAAINTTIRPLLLGQFANPCATEMALWYVQTNFGAPSKYFYGVGGAAYFNAGSTDTTLNGLFASLDKGLNSTMAQFVSPAFNGGQTTYSGITFQSLAKYYDLKTVSYEGAADLTAENAALAETAASDPRSSAYAKAVVTAFITCGNDLYMYYDLAGPAGDVWGVYEDISVPTEKSIALAALAATPLANFTPSNTECTAANPPTYPGGYLNVQ